MTDSNCEMPCWNGIIPGKTSTEELLTILDNLSWVDKKSIAMINVPWKIYDNEIYFSLDPNWLKWYESAIEVEAFIKNGKVVIVSFYGKTRVPIGEIIRKYGMPEGVVTVGSHRGEPIINAIIASKGIAFISVINTTDMDITEETPITGLVLFDPALYQAILGTGIFSDGNFTAEQTMKIMYPWNGYGNIDEKYPLRNPMQIP